MAKKKVAKSWMYSPKSAPKPKVPEKIKLSVQAIADEFTDRIINPMYVRREPFHPRIPYVVDLYNKWHRNFFYFCAKYRCPHENCIEEFYETRYSRLEYRAPDKYIISYMRHTGKWQEVYHDLTLEECLKTIEEEELFQPV